jgi:Ras-related GTP-binding protein C/D
MPGSVISILFRSGKSSIQKVVFHKMSPNETLFLESTNKVVKEDIANSSFVQFHIWDFPGQIDFFDPTTFDSDMIFGGCGALIFVIDAQVRQVCIWNPTLSNSRNSEGIIHTIIVVL